jgi:hypothetical protein
VHEGRSRAAKDRRLAVGSGGRPRAAKGRRVALVCLALAAVFPAPVAAASPEEARPLPGEGFGPGYCAGYGNSDSAFSYDDVYACATTYSKSTTPFDSDGNQSFQCVELSSRFLWAVYGIWASDVASGEELVAQYSRQDDIPVGRPAPGAVPRPGDVVSIGSPGHWGQAPAPFGHTAVVVSAKPALGSFVVMSQNWPAGHAGEQTWTIDETGHHDGEAATDGVYSTMSWLEVAKAAPAAPGTTAQVVFDDYLGVVGSVRIQGFNQEGQLLWACFTTPLTVDLLPGFWWQEGTDIWAYRSGNCSWGLVYGWPFTLGDSQTAPPYHCQEDVPPYTDWAPAGNSASAPGSWQHCAVWPPPKDRWHGYGVGGLSVTPSGWSWADL